MSKRKHKNALYITSYAGFGDLLYQTPVLKLLSSLYKNIYGGTLDWSF